MKKRFTLLLTTIILLLPLLACINKINTTTSIKDIQINKSRKVIIKNNTCKIIDKKNIIETLTSDKFEGRIIGSNGNKLTEDYIDKLFNDIGLTPLFNNKYKNKFNETSSNIIGKINGKSNDAIIISAHFDHIGYQDGKLIRGAIDNASGVSILLDVAETLKNIYVVEKPEFDIIFAAFNGEESGMTGSTKFVHDIIGKYDNLIDINIDSVGYINGGKITFLNNESYNNLNKLMKESLENNGLEVTLDNKILGRSDSDSFKRPEMKSICLIEENIKEVVHSEKDTPDIVNYSTLDKISKSIIELVTSITYTN